MIHIHRGSDPTRSRESADTSLSPASFIITAWVGDEELNHPSRVLGSTTALVARFNGTWDVRWAYSGQPLVSTLAAKPLENGIESHLFLSFPQDLASTLDLGGTPVGGGKRDNIWHDNPVPDLDILLVAQPWHKSFASRHVVKPGRRTICVSAAGEYGGQYYDGPIIHVRPDGTVASLIPSGGNATLRVPSEIVSAGHGIPWDEALALDAMSDEKVHRCLLARVDRYLGSIGAELVDYDLAELSPSAACLLVLMREARPELAIRAHLCTGGLGAQKGPWRRLTQNIGVELLEGLSGKKSPLSKSPSTLPTHLIGDQWAKSLMTSINRISDVIPRSLVP